MAASAQGTVKLNDAVFNDAVLNDAVFSDAVFSDAAFSDALAGADGTAAPTQRLQPTDVYPDPLADPLAWVPGPAALTGDAVRSAAAESAAPPRQAGWRSAAAPARPVRAAPKRSGQAQSRPAQPRPAQSSPAPPLARRPARAQQQASMVPAEFAVRGATPPEPRLFGGYHPLSTVAVPPPGYTARAEYPAPPPAVQRALAVTQHVAGPYTGPRAADLLSGPRRPPQRPMRGPAAPAARLSSPAGAARARAAGAVRSKPGKSSGIWGTVVFLVIMLFASGLGRQLLDWITQLFR